MDRGACRVITNNLEFVICISIDESEEKHSFDNIDYILAAYNEKYKFVLQAKIHMDSKEPMDDLLDQLRQAINSNRIVAQFDKNVCTLHVATLLSNPTLKYQTELHESKYNKFAVKSIINHIESTKRPYANRWYNYMRGTA